MTVSARCRARRVSASLDGRDGLGTAVRTSSRLTHTPFVHRDATSVCLARHAIRVWEAGAVSWLARGSRMHFPDRRTYEIPFIVVAQPADTQRAGARCVRRANHPAQHGGGSTGRPTACRHLEYVAH